MSRTRGGRVVLCLCAALCLWGAPASAEQNPDAAFSHGVSLLKEGAYSEAIDELEALADRGFVHPDASYNRAIAYIGRAESTSAQPGDLGRAAAALAETVRLRPSDEAAEKALSTVRQEIARRRARKGAEQVTMRPSLVRTVTELVAEPVWAIIAVIGSSLLTLGLGLRLFMQAVSLRLGGSIAAMLGALALCLGGGFAALARHYRTTSVPAVVVVPEARLLDETGRPVPPGREHDSIIEGASVYVYEEQGRLAHVAWGTTTGWVQRGQLRFLAGE